MRGIFVEDSKPYLRILEDWWKYYHPDKPFSHRVCSTYLTLVLDTKEECLIAAQFVYPALGSGCAWLGFTVRDPAISAFKAGKALRILFAKSEEAIRQMGWSIVYTNFDVPALQKLVAKRDYVGGSIHKEYWRDLWV